MSTQKSIETVSNYLKASYPAVWVKAYEEDKACSMFSTLAKELNFGLMVWSITKGFCNPNDEHYDKGSSVIDAISALNFILEEEKTSFTIYILKNFHYYLEDKNPMIIQLIKDLIPHLKKKGNQLVFLSPVVTLPIEIEKDITVLEVDMPDIQELDETLESIISSVSDKIQIDDRQRVLESALGLTCAEAENAFALAVTIHRKLDDEAIKTIQREKSNIIRKSGMLEFIAPSNTINDIGGASEFKKWLHTRRKSFSKEAKEFGVQSPKGVILLGISGGGKSAAVRAVGNLWQMPILRFNIGNVFGSLVGESEANMSRALRMAETISPSILWIDEIEKAFAGAGGSGATDSGVTARVLGEMLTWMQEKTSDVFVIATANNINHLPPELLRKGRFDELFWFDLPELGERKEIISIHLRKRNRDPQTFDIDSLAKKTEGFVGAELEQVVVDAISIAFSENHELTNNDLLEAARSTVPLSKLREAEISGMRAWAKERARNASAGETIEQPVRNENTILRRVPQ
ncbi:AAA family ATPase [Paenibacillus sp. Leaf72]|uniref:AAA family ATPase n=1 Tax=Paenibacillus sp. Leaf72 TaxID=1736234 RepID=UPI0006FA2B7D|nr:AAA family ATPase [Paenibacillus sp. Leaf72]KQN96864.1 hypothetical protein ASF12_22610 [Paenibacillus sp. Leaf72]